MPPGRVVLDSDEENDEAAAQPHPPSPLQKSNWRDAHTLDLSGAETQKSGEASTGSTDLLNREIQDAHRALMEPTPDSKVSDPSTNASMKRPSVSPTMSRHKRRMTMAGTPSQTAKPPTSVERRKSLKTYGSRDRGVRNSSVSDFAGPSSKSPSSAERPAGGKEDDDEWEVPGSSPSHDPLAARREAGSTKVKSRTAVKDTITVDLNSGKSNKRSKTLGGLPSGPITELPESAGPASWHLNTNQNKLGIPSSSGEEDDIMDQPRRKRAKRAITIHGHSVGLQQAVTTDEPIEAPSDALLKRSETNAVNSIAVDLSDPTLTFTTSQKDQYTVPSKTPSQPGVTPTTADVFRFGDAFARFPGESSTIPNTTPDRDPLKGVETSYTTKASTGSSELLQHLLPSSPPVDSTSRAALASASQRAKALRRSKSSVPEQQASSGALIESTASTTSTISPTIEARRNSRRKTTAGTGAQDPYVEASHAGTQPSIAESGAVERVDVVLTKSETLEKIASLETTSTKRKSGNDDPQADELGSDEVAIGLPKEQYKPRPSRSRSTRNADCLVEAVDFSKKPETLVKARIKRSKTLGASTKSDSLARSLKSSINLLENDRTIETERKGTEHLYSRHEKQETARDDVSDRETTTNKDASKVSDPDNITAEPQTEPKQHGPPEQGDVGNPDQTTQQAPVGEASMAAESNTGPSQPTHSPQDAQKDDDTTSIPKPRGRPRKASQTAKTRKRRKTDEPPIQPSEDSVILPTAKQQDITDIPASVSALAEVDANISTNQPSNPPPKGIEATPSPTPQKSAATSEVQTPKRTTSAKGPDKHSPLNSGKVPYRVGLSKRARIEPLLRIVKK
ncbi:MAG: hypothetical protein M1812_005188 [Candelaria pacifica]|nr:MAG: hypothetical protein M1812_005188 [Candelaria pacifica]